MRIFVTGATGFLGAAIVEDLIEAGHQVLGLARSDAAAAKLLEMEAEAHPGTLDDIDSLRRGAQRADGVIHTAFDHDFSKFAASCKTDRQAIEALGDALSGTEKPLIVTSGLPITPGRTATEADAPLTAADGMPRVSEQTALGFVDRGVRVSVIRMAQIHDARKQGFASYLLDHARQTGLSAYVADGANRWPAVHLRDAARLYRRVLKAGTSGARYHAVGEDGVTMREIATAIGRKLDLPAVTIATEDVEGHFGWLARIAQMDAPASSLQTRRALNWMPQEPALLVNDIAS
ncbi:nucleoside-diphosphate-sugar epimerase [Labrenzia sp. MBR-25]